MKKRVLSIVLSLCMLLNATSGLSSAMENFSDEMFKDVSPQDWFYDSVMASVNEEIFSGTGSSTFSPSEAMTRGMYVTIMGRMAQVDNSHPIQDSAYFTDLRPGAYYIPYVMWAVENGITEGTGNYQFSPDRPITREEMATFTARFFDVLGLAYPEGSVSTLPEDVDQISPWAREAVLKLWGSGYFNGDEKGNFNPQSKATRAEGAAFSVRINEGVRQWRLVPTQTEAPAQNDRGGSNVSYYKLTFDSNGGSVTESFSRRGGGTLSKLPVPYKEGAVFAGWYYDRGLTQLVGSNDLLRESLTLYARWGEAVPLAEAQNIRFASALDQKEDFSITIAGPQAMSIAEVEKLVSVKNFNSQEDKDWIQIRRSGSDFIISGLNYLGENGEKREGFEAGSSYRLSLNDDRLMFAGFSQDTREFNFTIEKEDVFNLTLNETMGFIKFEDITQISENGVSADTINSTPLSVNENGLGVGDLATGTFTYTQSTLSPGDTVAIYEGIHPMDRVLDDTREGADGNVAYVEITSVSDTVYGYKTAQAEDVLFTPDVLPVSTDADTDGNPYDDSITVEEEIFDFSDDLYAAIGLDSQTTVDVGDYISFYTGDLTANTSGGSGPEQRGFALITEVVVVEQGYVIDYEEVSLDDLLAAMDLYNTDPIDGEEMLRDVDVAALEAQIEQQAIDSGFAESAGQYLAAMAIETEAFTEISEDFKLNNYEILNENGDRLSLEEVNSMADGGAKVKVEVEPPEAEFDTRLKHFYGVSGLRLTLKIKAKITIGPQSPEDGDAQVVMTLTGEFEEEVRLAINIDGGARWEWWAIFPYIAEYEATANIDLFNYTGLKFHASIVTREYKDTKWTEDEELKNVVDELKKLVDDVKEGLGSDEVEEDPANDLIKKYKAMMDTESDWVNLVEKKIWDYSYRIPPIMIIEIKIELKFVIQANMNISLGAEFWYKTAKRYSYNVEVFAGNVTSDVLELVEEQYEFTFYVMGTLGLRAGLQVEASVSLFHEKFASVGFAAETGAYIRMYGYFYYQLTYKASEGKESKYSGALYFELGIYLQVTFEAQAFAGTFSYNPTLYENEWPLWNAGMRENIQAFAYGEDEAPELAMKKIIQTTYVPDGVFEMLYLDLKTGESDTKIYEDSEEYFTIEMTNDKFSYDTSTNKLTLTPEKNDIRVEGQMVVTWVNQPLTWTSKPISTRINLSWDNLNDGYAIVFHSNGGSSIPIAVKKYGEAVAPPADPYRKGYVFEGWYTDEALSQEYTFPQTMPNLDIEVYAGWTPATDTPYRVEHFGEVLGSSQYEMLEGALLSGTTDSEVTVETNDYDGYRKPQSRMITILPDGSSILRYYYDREIYQVTYFPGAVGGEEMVSQLKYGARIAAPALNSKGYSFLGWEPAIYENSTMPAGDISYSARWTPAEDTPYRVEYYVEQTSGRYTLQHLDSSRTGITGNQVALEAILDESYLVTNGISYRDTTVNGEATTTPVITKDGKLIIKVNYQRETHEAVFDSGNGEAATRIPVKYEAAIPAPGQEPLKQGYVFDGWEGFTSGTAMGTADRTFKAKWMPAEDTVYTVKHVREDLMGRYPGEGDLVEIETKYGKTEAQTEAQVKIFEGFTAGTVIQKEILPDGTAVVEIRYSRNSYAVNWMADGSSHKTEQVKYGDVITKPTKNPTKKGYIFASWSGFSEGSTMGIIEQNFTATWDPATDTGYTVRHLCEDLSGEYTIEAVQTMEGTTGTLTAASEKTYEGFTAETGYTQVEIQPDGSSEVEIRYSRNRYDIFWVANGEIFDCTPDVLFGAPIELPEGMPDNKSGYTFKGWENVPSGMPAGDTSYQAGWTANTYRVTFNVSGGDPLEDISKEVTYDREYGELPQPTRTGYEFVNWIDERGAAIEASSQVSTASNHELRADWAAETDVAYAVKHYQQKTGGDGYILAESTDGRGETDTETKAVSKVYQGFTNQEFQQENIAGDGSTVVTIYYDRNIHSITWHMGDTITTDHLYGAGITAPQATRTGYDFAGWNPVLADTMPDMDLSYDATWEAKTFKVSFDGNGGSSPGDKTVTYDSTYGGLPTPIRTGYDFDGWFTSASGGTAVDESTQVEITSAQTLYAHWTAREYIVSFDLNTGTGTAPGNITVSFDGKYTVLPANDAVKTGYTFKGWYPAASGGEAITSLTVVSTADHHTLYAQWQANTYQVEFDGNGGTGTMADQSHSYDQEKALTANSFARTGFSFSGWNTERDKSGTAYGNTARVENLATGGSVILYAQWTVNRYTISFDSNSGSYVAPITQDYGTAVAAPDEPVRTGYTFGAWQLDGEDYTLTTMPAKNITLVARWKTVDYPIDYQLSGGVNHVDNPSAYNIESENIALGDASGKAGYTFEGWYSEAGFINKLPDIAITAGETGPKTFYARWTANSYTVEFNKNTGDGTAKTFQTFTYDEPAKALTANTFIREGYAFQGWNSEADGTGTGYADSQVVGNLAQGGTVNLYAQWEPVTYAITYELNDGQNHPDNPSGYTVESEDIILKNPDRGSGYGFMGWYDNAALTGGQITEIQKGSTGGKTLYAKWGFAGTFTVANNGDNRFTITRTGNGGEDDQNVGQQTVYFRTINGSAIGDTHFAHQGGSAALVTFADGETHKTVTVTEYGVTNAYDGRTTTSYSNIDRTYQLELVKVVGGGLLGSTAKATRTMVKNNNYVIPIDVYKNYKQFAYYFENTEIFESINDYKGTLYTGVSGNPLTDRSDSANVRTYLQNTISAMKVKLDILGQDDGWRMIRYAFFNNHINDTTSGKESGGTLGTLPTGTKAAFVYGITTDTNNEISYSVTLPATVGTISSTPTITQGVSVFYSKYADGKSNSDYILYEKDEIVGISVATYNSAPNNSSYWFGSGTLYSAPYDIKEPTKLSFAPMAAGNYLVGETVTVAVVFDEIVADLNGATVSGTNLNAMTYAGGLDSNVLYFTGTVKRDVDENTILDGITLSGTVKDMSN